MKIPEIEEKKILFTILNWGLGHATRSSILIKALAQKNDLHLASSGNALKYLSDNFGQLKIYELPDYEMKYTYHQMRWNVLASIGMFVRSIRKEYIITNQLDKEEKYDLLISDQRYGTYIPSKKNIFITHQLNLQAPTYIEKFILNQFQHRQLRKFQEIWIPDYQKEPRLSGKMSKAGALERKCKYIDPLSRFPKEKPKREGAKYDIMVLLSGPEPARSRFEKKMLHIAEGSKKKFVFVSGKVGTQEKYAKQNIDYYSFLDQTALADLISQSRTLVCRSGYSTLMDLERLERRAILVPTPGQSEQIYLAQYFSKTFGWKMIKEKELTEQHLNTALEIIY